MQAYPLVCTYYALYKLGRFSFYLLVPGHTGSFSLLANASFTCRFAPPLALCAPAGPAGARPGACCAVLLSGMPELVKRVGYLCPVPQR